MSGIKVNKYANLNDKEEKYSILFLNKEKKRPIPYG
jgi:hypothetical protein